MAENKNQGEPTFAAKRKPDLSCGDQADFANKTQKLQVSDNTSSPAEQGKTDYPENIDNNSSVAAKENEDKFEAYADPEDEEDEDEDEDDDDGQKSNGKSEVDRNGKGIMREDKGKGKLIEEEDVDDSDDDDSSDSGSDFEDEDGDLADDPLAEVDLENILPSRTRRRQVQPGVYIANDIANNSDDEDDDSDDPDALR